MAVLAALLLLSVSVKQDHAPLRTGCDEDANTVAAMPKGAAVTIRYALAGSSAPCYRVSVEADGKTVEGFLPASALDGVEEFEHGVRDAPWLGLSEVMSAVRPAFSTSGAAPGRAGANPSA